MSEADISRISLDALRARITRIFPAQIRAAVDGLTEAQIWWRPNESSNSIGNLILHLTGSLDHNINRALGGYDYRRDRAAEFAERRPIPREQLLERFDAMVARAEETFRRLTPQRLHESSIEEKKHSTIFEDLLSVAMHLANHTGQIVWIAKMFREGVVEEIWIRTHRELGGSPR